MKEETKVKDKVQLSIKTTVPSTVPYRDIPPSKILEVKSYRDREWVMLIIDKKTFEELKTLCESKGLDVRKVLYGTLVQLKDALES